MEQELHVLNKPCTLHKHAHTKDSPEHCGGVVSQSAEPTCCTMSTTILKRDLDTGELCNNIGLVGMSQHHLAIMTKPSLSCLFCFLCMLAIPIFPI